jgi:hypothetical protein
VTLVGNVPDAAAKVAGKDTDQPWTVSSSDGYVYTSPVGKFQANQFGLCDMHGDIAVQGGAITYDVPIQKNGLIPRPFVDQLRAVGRAMQ